MFKKYIDYIKDNPEGYWFKRKLYGWGWVLATWQGWLITGIYAVLVIAFALTIDTDSPAREVMFTFFLPVFILTALFIQIAYRTGEKPRWQWGFSKKEGDTPGSDKDCCNDGKGVSMGVALGVALGAALGAALHNVALGIAIGISIGVAIGAGIDAQNKK